jgi:hypothetical protein
METWEWILVITAAGLFGSRMHHLFDQFERKLRGPGDSEKGRR